MADWGLLTSFGTSRERRLRVWVCCDSELRLGTEYPADGRIEGPSTHPPQ